MVGVKINGLLLQELKIISGDKGSVLHALRQTDASFAAFGEAYFSTLEKGVVKGWKKHNRMILNIIVPVGEIRFIVYDDREGSSTKGMIDEIILSRKSYQRLTIPPGLWMAFQGLSHPENILLNVASIEHDPIEAISLPLNTSNIPFNDW